MEGEVESCDGASLPLNERRHIVSVAATNTLQLNRRKPSSLNSAPQPNPGREVDRAQIQSTILQKACKEVRMPDSRHFNEDERTFINLARTNMTLQRAIDLELSRVGLTIPQAGVLYFLKTTKEPLTPMKLSRRLHRQPHTVSALVTRMEAQGLVKATKDLERKNWVRLSLTKKGQEAFKRELGERIAFNATSCLSKKERDTLNEICKKLSARGGEIIRQMQPGPYSDMLV